MDFRNPVVLLALVAVVFSVAFVGYGFMLSGSGTMASDFSHSDERFEQFVSSELEDNCTVPKGYDEAAWKQHMSHHPDRYQGCDF